MRPTERNVGSVSASPSDLETPITLVVCTNKLAHYIGNIEAIARLRAPADRLLCIVDENGPPARELLQLMEKLAIDVRINRKNEGLSHNRNLALELCSTRHLLFLDDDVTLTPDGLSTLRAAARSGARVAGLRLAPPAHLMLDRWFITPCQWHYLALHRPDRPASVWGACMLIDVEAARRLDLQFQANLGRRGAQLQSGDDTTFIKRLQQPAIALDDPPATHHIASERLRFRYLLRRAYWQGVSEVRRRSAMTGLAKELKRNLDFQGFSLRRLALAGALVSAVAYGVFAGWLGSLSGSRDE